LLTQCQVAGGHAAFGLSCCATLPQVDGIFFAALPGSAALNWGATLLSTRALAAAAASLVSPLLTFHPAFTLLVAWLTLGEMPGGGGLSAAKALHEQLPSCRIVILTTFGRSGYLRRAMESGAVGFLLKEAPTSELAVAIRRVMDGDRVVDPNWP
jgi:DNA-binding NarL/FixJ family response regulator